MAGEARLQHLPRMENQLFTAIGREPVPIELPSVEEIVSDSTYKEENKLGLRVVRGQLGSPIQFSFNHHLLLRRMRQEVVNRRT